MNTSKGNKFSTVLKAFGILLAFMALLNLIVMVIGGAQTILAVANGVVANDQIELTNYFISTMAVAQFIAEIICIVVLGFWYYKAFVKKAKSQGTYESGFKKIASIKDIAFIVSMTLTFYFLDSIIASVVMTLVPGSGELFGALMNSITSGNVIAGMLTVMLLGPIAEELAFRGVMLQTTKKGFGIVGCIVVTAIMFGIMHMNPVQTIYAIPIGAALAFIAYKYNSLVPAMIAHVLNNSLSVILSKLVSELNEVVCVIMIVVFGALSIFLYKQLPARQEKTTEQDSRISA